MSNFDYTSIDGNRPATAKQFGGVAAHMAALHDKTPKGSWASIRMFKAIFYRKYSESNTQMTHAEVQKYFKCKQVPKELVAMIKTKPTASTPTKTKSPAKSSKKTPAPKKTDLEQVVAAQGKQIEELTQALNVLLTSLQ